MNRALAAAFLTACIVVGITLSLARTPLSRPAPEARRPADLPRERPVEPKPPRDRPVEPEPEPAPGPHDPRRPDTPPIERDRHEKATESYRRYLVVPAGVEEAAAELGASEAAVLDAFMAEWQIYAAAQQPSPIKDEAVAAAVRALAVRGHDGYLAVVSLVRGNGTGPSYFELVRATWQPGWESDLLAVARDEHVPLHAGAAALEALGAVDTPEVRRLLVDTLRDDDTDLVRFVGATRAAGALREPGATRAIASKLARRNWAGGRRDFLAALGRIANDDARAAVLAYLEKPPRRQAALAVAIVALFAMDEESGRAAAERLVDDIPEPRERARVERLLRE